MKLRQLQLVHRHGDRTPLMNLFKGKERLEEQEFQLWTSFLPSTKQLATLSARFPPKFLSEDVQDPEAHFHPFGTISSKGIRQLSQRGKKLAEFCRRENLAVDQESARGDALVAYSNIYTRTQISAQAFLQGLYDSLDDPNSSSIRKANKSYGSTLSGFVKHVNVLGKHQDVMNTYNRFPQITHLTSQLETTDELYRFREFEMEPTKHELTQLFPLFRDVRKPFHWMAVADYFMCREANGLPFLESAKAHYDSVLSHIGFRFYRFYSNRDILRYVAGKLTRSIIREMTLDVQESPYAKQIIEYSGHDISVLALLHVLGADIIREESWWPTYGCMLAMELVENSKGQLFLRVRLDDKLLSFADHPDGCIPYEEFKRKALDVVGPGTAKSVETKPITTKNVSQVE